MEDIFMGKQEDIEWYRREIIEMIEQIEDVWILEQILKCIININK